MKKKKETKVIRKITDLRVEIAAVRSAGKRVGFVPTMGALHDGHLQLVKRCVSENDFVVVSVFVNPTQFNDKNDLLNYPRDLDRDVRLLEDAGCDVVFAPEVEEMYPEEDHRKFDFGLLDKVMEGKFRPGHFNGVAQIVSKLFYAVTPDRAYFGEKDFQQLAIIRRMTKQMGGRIKIEGCPIVRELDGMALSSRNVRLTPEQRKNATKISETLFKSRTFVSDKSVRETTDYVIRTLNDVPDMKVEYFEIVDGTTLQPVTAWDDTDYVVGCVAAYCGAVRLIDNVTYKK